MRSVEDTRYHNLKADSPLENTMLTVSRKRWTALFCDDSSTDLREALKSEQGNNCSDGLRSVCWKVWKSTAFLARHANKL